MQHNMISYLRVQCLFHFFFYLQLNMIFDRSIVRQFRWRTLWKVFLTRLSIVHIFFHIAPCALFAVLNILVRNYDSTMDRLLFRDYLVIWREIKVVLG